MAQTPIKLGSFTATTTGTVSITPSVAPNAGVGGLGANLFLEVTAISAGSAVTTSGAIFKWLSPGGGTSAVIATSGGAPISATSGGQFLTFAATNSVRCLPVPNQVNITFQTVGATNGIACDLYLIPAN